MENILATIHRYFIMSVATLFLFQSLILFIRSKNSIARRTMAFIELLWGLVYVSTLILMYVVLPPEEYSLLREKVLIIGSFYITLTHFFPMQVLVPGWLNLKRAFLFMLPNIVLTIIYYGVMACTDESPECIISYAMLGKSLGHFNVWFRFVFLFGNFIYMICILRWLYGYENKYIRWKNDNFSDQEYVDISWMRFYDCILIGIFLLYIAILLFGGRIPVLFHCTFVIISFSYLFYKSLFYESPYPEDFFKDEDTSVDVNTNIDVAIMNPTLQIDSQSENSFESNIQTYTSALKTWMEKEKPFLYHDFKLTDLSHLIPLNRSYLSRIVNEGFGKNFNEVVRMYRVNYSKDILIKNPTLPVYKVADMCGFSSDTTFIKAFKQIENMTPAQYRAKNEKVPESSKNSAE